MLHLFTSSPCKKQFHHHKCIIDNRISKSEKFMQMVESICSKANSLRSRTNSISLASSNDVGLESMKGALSRAIFQSAVMKHWAILSKHCCPVQLCACHVFVQMRRRRRIIPYQVHSMSQKNGYSNVDHTTYEKRPEQTAA